MNVADARKRRIGARQMVSVARDSDHQLFLTLYCDYGSCSARDIALRVKDYDHTLLDRLIDRTGLHCPVCGKAPLQLQGVLTAEQWSRREQRDARCSVNSQMRRRDYCNAHGGERTLFIESVAEMLDERLPPTPDGYFQKRDF